MGLLRDGSENMSVVMDRDYTEPRSSDHDRKNSQDKNHRTSGERGVNGSRPVPVEKPLSVIINRNDGFENGHYSSSKSSYNHLLDEEFTKKTFDVIHGHSSSTSSVMNCAPSTSSSHQNVSFTSPPRLGNRQEEVMKRRNIVEKIERLKEGKKIDTFIAQMDLSTPNQVSMNVRRYARQDNPNVPVKMRNFILEGCDSDVPVSLSKVKNNVQSISKRTKIEEDGEATDYEDLDEKYLENGSHSSRGSSQWLMERADFVVMDTKLSEAINTTDQIILSLLEQLKDVEAADREIVEGVIANGEKDEERCARLIPWDGSKRRKLVKMDEYLLNTLPCTSKETAALNPPSFTQQAMQYLHRTAIMASFHIRKNITKSMWRNSRELEEEKSRNGVRKKEERDRREKRKMERAEKEEDEEEKSDEYEATDDEDEEDEESMPVQDYSRKSNGGPREKKRKKDRERKASRREINKNRRSSDCLLPSSRLSSVASRPSLDGDIDFLTPIFNHATWLDSFKCQMPTNFTYNKIPVPDCKRVRIEQVAVETIEEATAFSTESMMKKMASAHHQLEHEERIRFTMNPRGLRPRGQRGTSREQRETSQESGRSRSTPSNGGPSEEGEVGSDTAPTIPLPTALPSRTRVVVPRPSPIPHFDYNFIRPVSDYERLSIDPPYQKRQFAR